MAVEINANLITRILYEGPAGTGMRYTQSSPILREVWLRYAASSGVIRSTPAASNGDTDENRRRPAPVDLLIVPHFASQAVDVADMLDRRVQWLSNRKPKRDRPYCDVADLPGMVAARLEFADMCACLLPQTDWWWSSGFAQFICLTEDSQKRLVTRWAKRILGSTEAVASQDDQAPDLSYNKAAFGDVRLALRNRREQPPSEEEEGHWDSLPHEGTFQDIAGMVVLMGLIGTGEVIQDPAKIQASHIARSAAKIAAMMRKVVLENADPDAKVYTINLNRSAEPAITFSVPTTKADAAHRLFDLDCAPIGWAILDSGVDADHPSFAERDENGEAKGRSRVVASYDMTFFRRILSRDILRNAERRNELAKELSSQDMSAEDAAATLQHIKANVEARRPTDLDSVEKLLRRHTPKAPENPHGTHVAGILGAGEFSYLDRTHRGMCPTIKIYDFRVLAETLQETEFAVIGALQLIAHINRASKFTRIHGANLSLSLPHDVMNYACGRTPVCMECENLVNTGVVVVAAAGNRGYNEFLVSDGGSVQLHTSTSITDPGNTEAVITVGSTHRIEPHNYGVSYFSSRGPTGDGRAKPDLVAPGEKIRAPFPSSSGRLNDVLGGTSMAAPHVSGAAAMLMARYPEMIGQPARVKRILCSTATDLGRKRDYQGHGLVDVLRALQSV